MRVIVDQEKCCGAGQCVLRAPEVFAQHEQDRVVILLQSAPAGSLRDEVRDAAFSCPTGAIELSDDTRSRQVVNSQVE